MGMVVDRTLAMEIRWVNVYGRHVSEQFHELIRGVGEKVSRDDVEVTVSAADPGLERTHDALYSYCMSLNKPHVLEAVIEAEEDGVDAVVFGDWLDDGLREAKEAVDVPVIGEGISSLALASMLGDRYAILGPSDPNYIAQAKRVAHMYKYTNSAVNQIVYPIESDAYELVVDLFEDPEKGVAEIKEAGRRAVNEGGADTIVIGSSGMAAMYQPHVSSSMMENVEELQFSDAPSTDVPVIDCITSAVKMAEMRVDLEDIDLRHSTAGMNLPVRTQDRERVRSYYGLID
jgi:Asp/Glu/hydantoin racemase